VTIVVLPVSPQDLEQSKTLPQIWAELRKKDERVSDLEAQLLMLPTCGEKPSSQPTTPPKDNNHMLSQLRDVEQQLRKKETQVRMGTEYSPVGSMDNIDD